MFGASQHQPTFQDQIAGLLVRVQSGEQEALVRGLQELSESLATSLCAKLCHQCIPPLIARAMQPLL